jgi:NADH:ubiquinone oxidoreductase subunit 6 (subunit J)
MNLSDGIFLAIAGITLLGGVLAVWPRNVFYNAMALILCLFGVAGLFLYLNSEFLAVVEVIIYIGAISVAIIFAIMLSKPWGQKHQPRSIAKVLKAGIAAALLLAGLLQTVHKAPWLSESAEGDYSIQNIGRGLLTEYALPFEVVSLILLIAIIGALVISRSKDAA